MYLSSTANTQHPFPIYKEARITAPKNPAPLHRGPSFPKPPSFFLLDTSTTVKLDSFTFSELQVSPHVSLSQFASLLLGQKLRLRPRNALSEPRHLCTLVRVIIHLQADPLSPLLPFLLLKKEAVASERAVTGHQIFSGSTC